MRWLYKIQRYVAITAIETTVVLVLAGLLMLGAGVHHWRMQQIPPLADHVVWPAADTVRTDTVQTNRAHPNAGMGNPEFGHADAGEREAGAATAASIAQYEAESPLAAAPPPPVDVNAAEATELQRLSGIGPALSQRIISYRDANGPFRSAEELQNVPGIGPKTVERIQGDIVIQMP
ncbi:MAG: helix-hairpin-helix domain-containing protein [Longimonas sp.]|uniref:ComEA family DNA-binding protein n=1 Tax=Longimonas sp. TaxID=2039626 RepID=UPI00335A370A